MIKLIDITNAITESVAVKQSIIKYNLRDIVRITERIIQTYKDGGKLILFGNGGSASDAQHIACEFVCSGLPAISLCENASVLTAILNDKVPVDIFWHQLEVLANPNDCVMAISTSGESQNVYVGVTWAKRKGIATVALTGNTGGALAGQVDIPLIVHSDNTQRIQESHIMIGHIIWQLVCDNQ